MVFEKLIVEFANLIGVPELVSAEAGRVVEIDEVMIAIHHDEGFGRVVLLADVGAFPADRSGTIASKLIRLNFVSATMGGHSVVANAESGRCYAVTSLPLVGLTLDRFDAELALLIYRAKGAAAFILAEDKLSTEPKVDFDTVGSEMLIMRA